jgi:SAM-dependent methyltransferase
VTENVENLYRNSEDNVRSSFGQDQGRALAFYSVLIEFIEGLQPNRNSRLLDVGCGVGWSTYAFALEGYQASGIDLNPQAFEPPPHDRCLLREGSATDIPEPSDSFDIVVCYQCLEHVTEPKRALDEMARVCRPGGIVAIVGPNLVSPFPKLAELIKPSSWRGLPLQRRAGMARHPYGNTLPEILGFAGLRGVQLVAKLFRRAPAFSMRAPDLVPPFHSDNDACYLCNPTDLIKDFRQRGFELVRRGKPGRPPLSYLFAGGTWVAARKPTASPSRSDFSRAWYPD